MAQVTIVYANNPLRFAFHVVFIRKSFVLVNIRHRKSSPYRCLWGNMLWRSESLMRFAETISVRSKLKDAAALQIRLSGNKTRALSHSNDLGRQCSSCGAMDSVWSSVWRMSHSSGKGRSPARCEIEAKNSSKFDWLVLVLPELSCSSVLLFFIRFLVQRRIVMYYYCLFCSYLHHMGNNFTSFSANKSICKRNWENGRQFYTQKVNKLSLNCWSISIAENGTDT